MIAVHEKVRFVETDLMGVAHHSNHFCWFELARVQYLREAGIDLNDMMAAGYMFPIWEVKCRYLLSACFDDDIVIEAWLSAASRAKMEFSYRLWRAADKALLAEGKTVNVFTSRSDGKVVRLPDDFYTRIKAAYIKDKAVQH